MYYKSVVAFLCTAIIASEVYADEEKSETEAVNFLRLAIGDHDLQQWQAEIDFGSGVTLPGMVSINSDYAASIAFGREYQRLLFQLEYAYGSFAPGEVRIEQSRETGNWEGSYRALTLDAGYKIPLTQKFRLMPVIGAGVARANLPLMINNGCQCFKTARSSGVVYKAQLDLDYSVNNRLNFFLSLQGLLNIEGPTSPEQAFPSIEYTTKDVFATTVGLRWSF